MRIIMSNNLFLMFKYCFVMGLGGKTMRLQPHSTMTDTPRRSMAAWQILNDIRA